VNPMSGVMSPPAAARSDTVIDVRPAANSWPGLAQASSELGVPLDDEALQRFARYRDLLHLRNAQFNLTAIREPHEIERRLFLDALAIVPTLDRLTESPSPQSVRRVDIGAGAGFPGLALKIARPHLDVTLVDATAKKVAFLDEVISELGLDAVRAVHGRAEDLGQKEAYRARFDVATARAVAALPVLLEYVIPLLEVGGTALLTKGLEINEELRAGRRAAQKLGARIISAATLPTEGTRLVVATKTAPTKRTYPRRVGIPSRGPLGDQE
jgi:16S rRNA (guanine527-N7)-methyltransferase